MTISAVCNPLKIKRNSLLVFVLMVLLAGCIQPDAPLPGATAVTVTPVPVPPTSAPVAGVTPVAPVPQATAAPTPNNAANVYPLDQDRVWKRVPVGPEQVAILFFQTSGNRCVRYIFRAKVVPKCAVTGQTAVAISGSEQAADGNAYTIVVGRAIDTRITVVSIEWSDGSNSPAQIDNQGFVLVVEGARKPIDAVPVDQHGDLVGAKVTF